MLPSFRLIAATFLCGFVVMFASLRVASSLNELHEALPITATRSAPAAIATMPTIDADMRRGAATVPVMYDLRFAVSAASFAPMPASIAIPAAGRAPTALPPAVIQPAVDDRVSTPEAIEAVFANRDTVVAALQLATPPEAQPLQSSATIIEPVAQQPAHAAAPANLPPSEASAEHTAPLQAAASPAAGPAVSVAASAEVAAVPEPTSPAVVSKVAALKPQAAIALSETAVAVEPSPSPAASKQDTPRESQASAEPPLTTAVPATPVVASSQNPAPALKPVAAVIPTLTERDALPQPQPAAEARTEEPATAKPIQMTALEPAPLPAPAPKLLDGPSHSPLAKLVPVPLPRARPEFAAATKPQPAAGTTKAGSATAPPTQMTALEPAPSSATAPKLLDVPSHSPLANLVPVPLPRIRPAFAAAKAIALRAKPPVKRAAARPRARSVASDPFPFGDLGGPSGGLPNPFGLP